MSIGNSILARIFGLQHSISYFFGTPCISRDWSFFELRDNTIQQVARYISYLVEWFQLWMGLMADDDAQWWPDRSEKENLRWGRRFWGWPVKRYAPVSTISTTIISLKIHFTGSCNWGLLFKNTFSRHRGGFYHRWYCHLNYLLQRNENNFWGESGEI